ncbi:MAG: hypothetical protein WBH03_13710, partial [Cyclobacteriaceae bacterium]
MKKILLLLLLTSGLHIFSSAASAQINSSELWTQSSPTFQRANATVNPGKNVVLNLENYRQTLSLASLNKSQTY